MQVPNPKYALSYCISSLFLMAITPNLASAIQHDAPFLMEQEKNSKIWLLEDDMLAEKLEDLQKKHGKKPNIIYILADDIGWGEPGVYGMGKMRGNPTPNFDSIAKSGIKFLQAYAEPSCTPSRIAIMTGRHPVRTGVNGVIWPGQTLGLPPEEVTIAELLKQGDYSTYMFGKWHLGDLDKHSPVNQGFDYAYYGLYNGAPFNWPDVEGYYTQDKGKVMGNAFFFDYPGDSKYEKKYGINIHGIFEQKAGQARKEVMKLASDTMDKVEANSIKKIVDIIKNGKNSKKPYFIYWATYANQIAGSPPAARTWNGVDLKNNTAVQFAQHDKHLKMLMEALKGSGEEENTLVVWISDNGPMYAFYPNSGYSWLKGGKGEVTEGGVRVPAIAYWKGMIKPGQDPLDFLQITDLFTTAATLGGVADKIPNDRVTDGINQLPLLLNGEGHGRRNYMFHYNGPVLGAVRLDEFKLFIKSIGSSVPDVDIYNIMRDPREKFGHVYPYLFLITPFQDVIKAHMKMIKKFPHNKLKDDQDVHETKVDSL
jgi:arylsulfatase A-like enzyme